MAGAASGMPGFEGVMDWRTLAGVSLIEINKPNVWPFYKVTDLPGWFTGPDTHDNRAPKTGTFGEELYTSYSLGKTVGIGGFIIGQTRDECLVGKTSLVAAFGPDITTGIVPERRMVVTPHAGLVDPYDPAPSLLAHTFTGVVQSGHPRIDDTVPRRIRDEAEPARKWALPFSIAIRITDGRYYEWDEATDTQSNPKWA